MTPYEAWEGYVGDQTPQEFMEISASKGFSTIEQAVADYVADLPDIQPDVEFEEGDLEQIAVLLAQYIRQNTTQGK